MSAPALFLLIALRGTRTQFRGGSLLEALHLKPSHIGPDLVCVLAWAACYAAFATAAVAARLRRRPDRGDAALER